MLFLNTKTNEYPRYQGDLELLGWIYGEPLPTDWVEVVSVEPPIEVPKNSKVVEQTPIEIEGGWTQVFKIEPMTAEEIEQRDAPITVKAKLIALGLTEVEIHALSRGLLR